MIKITNSMGKKQLLKALEINLEKKETEGDTILAKVKQIREAGNPCERLCTVISSQGVRYKKERGNVQ